MFRHEVHAPSARHLFLPFLSGIFHMAKPYS
jgi:hypothetical protein